MFLHGSSVISYLQEFSQKQDDPGESSHWREFNASFAVTSQGFSGLRGFGGFSRPYFGLRSWMHRILQRPFRQMGAQFGEGWQQVDEVAAEITASQNRAYDLDVLRQALTVAMLRHLGNSILTPNSTACVIGDGFATTTSLLLGTASAGAVVMVNLQKQLLVDLVFLREYLGRSEFERRVMLTVEPCQEFKITQDSIIAVMARDHTVIRQIPIDYAINIASMQEMNPPVIEQYFSDLRHVASARPVHLYCCNREEKTLPDGTVIRFLEYPWKGEDQILHEGLPLWHQEYYSVIPPFYRPYDGPHMHRWVRLTGNVGSSGAS